MDIEPDHHRGIENEPHLQNRRGSLDPSEDKAKALLRQSASDVEEQATVHSVHDELAIFSSDEQSPVVIDRDFSCPSCGYNLRTRRVGEKCSECGEFSVVRPSPTDKPGYAQWILAKRAKTGPGRGWLVTFLIVLGGGPWAILGALLWGGGGIIGMVIVGPVVEEMMKLAATATLVETRPYLFRSIYQLRVAALGSAFAFATIENVVYLTVYFPNPSAMLVVWRWTVCTIMHVSATAIASEGVIRVWRKHEVELDRPRITEALPWVVGAVVLHGIYNGLMLVAEMAGFSF